MDIVVKEVKLTGIKPYPNNPRANKETVVALVESIKRYGFNVPLVLDKTGVIITGHARYEASKQMKLQKVPTITVQLSKAKAKRYRLADNKIQDMTKWDDRALMTELKGLPSFEKVAGFSTQEKALYSSLFSATGNAGATVLKRRVVASSAPEGGGVQTTTVAPRRRAGVARDITQTQVDATQQKADNKFVERGEKYTEGLITIACKGCGASITVLRVDLERM